MMVESADDWETYHSMRTYGHYSVFLYGLHVIREKIA